MRIFPYLTCWYCSTQPTSRRCRPRQDTAISAGCSVRLYCWLQWGGRSQRKKPRSWIRKTKHQAAAGLGRVIDGMIFGLVSFFASVVYWLHDVHLCIHIGLLRLRPAGLCTGLHSCWGQYLISLGSNMVRIQGVSLVLRKSSGRWTPTLYCRSAPDRNGTTVYVLIRYFLLVIYIFCFETNQAGLLVTFYLFYIGLPVHC